MRQYNLHEKQEGFFILLSFLYLSLIIPQLKVVSLIVLFCWHSVVTKCTNWIHPEQGSLLRMCHSDDVLDPSGIIRAFLILCCLMGECFNTWIWCGYFLFKCWCGFIGCDIFLAFYSQVWYIMSSVFTSSKVELIFMLQ